jgi:ABC-2 type transport system ATP-binding protein
MISEILTASGSRDYPCGRIVSDVSQEVALRCAGLVKRYGALTAVADVSFEVRRGECFGLLGPNGAGKTTTMEMLEGLTEPDAGEVAILGRGWAAENRNWLRARLGVQLQRTELPDRLTVGETLRLFRSFFPSGATVEELLALMTLEEKRDARVMTLSGGQKQRLSLSCALAGSPEVLFLDEPTTGLDPQARFAVWSVVEGFLARGGTVLITTHYMEEAERLCDRVAIVDHGRIVALDSPAGLIAATAASQVIELELARGGISAAQLAALPAVTRVDGEGRAFRLASTAVGETLPALLAALTAHGDRLASLSTRMSTLADVFVALTGRALRDG